MLFALGQKMSEKAKLQIAGGTRMPNYNSDSSYNKGNEPPSLGHFSVS
jgi:hypothetical protein